MKILKIFSDTHAGPELDTHMTWDNGKVEILYCHPMVLPDAERWTKAGVWGLERRDDFTCESYGALASEECFFDMIARSINSQFGLAGTKAEVTDV